MGVWWETIMAFQNIGSLVYRKQLYRGYVKLHDVKIWYSRIGLASSVMLTVLLAAGTEYMQEPSILMILPLLASTALQVCRTYVATVHDLPGCMVA